MYSTEYPPTQTYIFKYTFVFKHPSFQNLDIQNNRIFMFICMALFLFPQHMLRVSFSTGRDRACRHCWISSVGTPIGETAAAV